METIIVLFESDMGEEFYAQGSDINEAIYNMRQIWEDANVEQMTFYRAKEVKVKAYYAIAED